MVGIRRSRTGDGARLVEIWREAVDATHDFLTPEDRLAIGNEVQEFLPLAPLWVAVDEHDRAIGFMHVEAEKMEALFVDPEFHGQGVGRALVAHALRALPAVKTAVNEQNLKAVGFYEHIGFVRTGRSPVDDQGRAYPLIHMRLARD